MNVEAKAGIEVEGEAESSFNETEEAGEFTGDAEDVRPIVLLSFLPCLLALEIVG